MATAFVFIYVTFYRQFLVVDLTGAAKIPANIPAEVDFILVNPARTTVREEPSVDYLKSRGWVYIKNRLPHNKYEVAEIERICYFRPKTGKDEKKIVKLFNCSRKTK